MRKGLREDILETARNLFARDGYNSVSMRDIAKELGVSVGNVTYYFKKKDELIEAAVLERAKNPEPFINPSTLYQLNEFFWEMAETQAYNTYYFRHYTQLAQISPRVYEIQLQRISQLTERLENAFATLQKSGIIEAEEYPGQNASFIQGLLRITLSWLSRYMLQEQNDIDGLKHDFIDCLWSMIYPSLTRPGRQEYLSVLRSANETRLSN